MKPSTNLKFIVKDLNETYVKIENMKDQFESHARNMTICLNNINDRLKQVEERLAKCQTK